MNSPFRCAASCFLHIYTSFFTHSFFRLFFFRSRTPPPPYELTHDENGIWSCREFLLARSHWWMDGRKKNSDAELHFFSIYFFSCMRVLPTLGRSAELCKFINENSAKSLKAYFALHMAKQSPIDNRSTMRKSVDLVAVQCSKSHTKWMCATDSRATTKDSKWKWMLANRDFVHSIEHVMEGQQPSSGS